MITLCTVVLASALAVSPGVTPAKAPKPCKDRVVAWIDKAGFTAHAFVAVVHVVPALPLAHAARHRHAFGNWRQ